MLIDATQFADALQQQCRALHTQRTDPHETPARQARAHVMEMTLQLVIEAVEACEMVEDGLVDVRGI